MINNITLRLFTHGGIVTPEEVRKIIEVARLCSCDRIMPGSRQEIYLQMEKENLAIAERELSRNAIQHALLEDPLQNIVTSFASLQILPTTAWLLGDTYLDILDSFTYQPKLKINIVDPLQNLVPLFTGELNFIASSYPRYWHLYINFHSFGKKQAWPVLIDGEDIAAVAKVIEEIYSEDLPSSIQDLFVGVSQKFTGRTLQREEELHLPVHQFPLIEGLHPYGSSYWLGIYRRNQSFPISFLEALYKQCIKSKIGKICLTPHKTLLMKDIRAEEVLQWKKLLGIHRIQIQHSALELNWQLPDLDQQAIQLKNKWVQGLEENEVYTSGLSFAIQTNPLEVAAPILIRQSKEAAHDRYAIVHTHDFTSHSHQWQVVAADLSEQAVASVLIDLCQVYYSLVDSSLPVALSEEEPVFIPTHEVYQCVACLTIYDPEFGDGATAVPAGTAFQDLPETYTCSLCESPKNGFVLVETNRV